MVYKYYGITNAPVRWFAALFSCLPVIVWCCNKNFKKKRCFYIIFLRESKMFLQSCFCFTNVNLDAALLF